MPPTNNAKHFLRKQLMLWHRENPRSLPWKATRDAYHIWLSEIILQQTQVSQGIPYYQKFVERYPTVHALAAASEEEVLRDWQGLGYNSRARHLHQAARYIVQELNGVFPTEIEGIRALKGVGEYTAAAIGSFAFGLSEPVLDTNVYRIYCRYFGFTDPLYSSNLQKQIRPLARELIREEDPAEFNQALMNFGALQCVAKKPNCPACVLQNSCSAYQSDTVSLLPVKKPKRPRKTRFFHYLVVAWEDHLLIRQRAEKDIWQMLFDFPCVETKSSRAPSVSKRSEALAFLGHGPQYLGKETGFRQTLTHQQIEATFYCYSLSGEKPDLHSPYRLVDPKNLRNFALPKIVRNYIFRSQLGILFT